MKAWFLRCWLAVLRVCEGSTHPQQAGHSCIMSGSAVPSSKPASSTFTNSVDIMCRGGVGDQVGAPLVWLADSGAVLQESLSVGGGREIVTTLFVLQKPLVPGVKIYPPLRCATSATGSTSRRGGRLCGVTSSEHRSRRARRGHSACLGESHECLGHLRAGHQVGWNARITFRRSPQDILLQYPASLSLCGTCRPRPLSYP